jgi:hypothetical protein
MAGAAVAAAALLVPALCEPPPPDDGGTRIGEREVPGNDQEAAKRLKELMPLWAATAKRYDNYALRFLCTETHRNIDYSRSAGEAKGEKETPYGYLLELDPKNVRYDVVRQTLDKDGQPTGEKKIDLKCPEPYLWSLLFLPTLSSNIRFHYLGREVQNYRLTHVVSFEGAGARVEGRDVREWTGTAWVEENTGNLVRIEARPCFQNERMHAVWQEFSQSFGIIGIKTKSRPHGYILAQLFDYERDGLLFPTRLDLAEFVWVGLNEEALDSRLVLTYSDYRFFKSEAQETIPPISSSQP